jgi:hypothetical protein
MLLRVYCRKVRKSKLVVWLNAWRGGPWAKCACMAKHSQAAAHTRTH